MRKYYGVKNKIHDIPLGVDLKLFKFSQRYRDFVRRKYKIKKVDFVVVYTGKVIKEKGVDILFESLNILAKKNNNLKLVVVGDANKDYKTICLSKLDKKYRSQVIWAGFQLTKDLPKFFSASDVGVWPLQESMSMNEAAACSIPFIANNTVGAKARLSNKNSFLYKKGSSQDLAKKIEFLIKNKSECKQMGKRGRELMEERFSWDNIAKEYIDFKK